MLGKLLQDPTVDLRVWKIPVQATLQQLKEPLREVRNLSITQVSIRVRRFDMQICENSCRFMVLYENLDDNLCGLEQTETYSPVKIYCTSDLPSQKMKYAKLWISYYNSSSVCLFVCLFVCVFPISSEVLWRIFAKLGGCM